MDIFFNIISIVLYICKKKLNISEFYCFFVYNVYKINDKI